MPENDVMALEANLSQLESYLWGVGLALGYDCDGCDERDRMIDCQVSPVEQNKR